MTENDDHADAATRPIRLQKDDQAGTQRIPSPPETQPLADAAVPSTYHSPPGQYGPEPAPPPPQYTPPWPQNPPPPQFHQPPQGYGMPAPAYNTAVVATGRPPASGVVIAIAWILAVVTFLYLLPWAVAATRNKSNQGGIFLINFFLGWSFIGWVIALVMACGSEPQGNNIVVVNQSSTQHYYR